MSTRPSRIPSGCYGLPAIHLCSQATDYSLTLSQSKPATVCPRRVLVANEARLYFALKGLGIAYMSEFSALEAGTLVTVLDEYTTEQNTFRLLWPSGNSSLLASNGLLAHIVPEQTCDRLPA